MKKIELEVIALSHSITHSHSYAVVLGELEGARRLPIVIGSFEAQAIAIALENMSPSRPLTHDLFKNLCEKFDIKLKEVIINNLADGIFYAQLIAEKEGNPIEIDSRTSDALALALRFNCRIYTYDFIMDSAGILTDDEGKTIDQEEEEDEETEEAAAPKKKKSRKKKTLKEHSDKELQEVLDKALKDEDYEKAAKVRDEISRRSGQEN